MTIIPTASSGSGGASAGGYASLTGAGETTPTGALTQDGSFTVTAAGKGADLFTAKSNGGAVTVTSTGARIHASSTAGLTASGGGTTVKGRTMAIKANTSITIGSLNGSTTPSLSIQVSEVRILGYLGFFDVTPAPQQAAIATPTATVTSLQQALAAVIATLRTYGLIKT